MGNTLAGKEVRAILKGFGRYFMEGQVTYELCTGGKFYAAENFLFNPMIFNVPKEDCPAIIASRASEKYIIDFIYENASKIEQLNVIFKDEGLKKSLLSMIEKVSPDMIVEVTESYRIAITPVEKTEEAPAPAEAPKAAAEAPVALEGDAVYLHVGIPVTNKKNDMTYLESHHVWVTDPANYDFKIEYLKFEEGTDLPNILHRNPHVAYMVKDMKKYLDQADWVIYGPTALNDTTNFAYIMMDNTIFELQAKK